MHSMMEGLEPHKDAFVGLVGAALDRSSGASVLGPESVETRARVEAAFQMLVRDATDAPDDPTTLARLLFVAHLLVVLVWTQDTSAGSVRAHRFVDIAVTALRAAIPMLPVLGPVMAPLTDLLDEFLES